jgi:hypothetical protein
LARPQVRYGTVMPHPRPPKEFVAGADESPSIDAAIISTNWEEGQARRAPSTIELTMYVESSLVSAYMIRIIGLMSLVRRSTGQEAPSPLFHQSDPQRGPGFLSPTATPWPSAPWHDVLEHGSAKDRSAQSWIVSFSHRWPSATHAAASLRKSDF